MGVIWMNELILDILGLVTGVLFDVILLEVAIIFGAIIYGDYIKKDEMGIEWGEDLND